MGFRSTFTTQDYNIAWPQWFIDKYARDVWFADDAKGAIHSKHEGKTHMLWCDLLPDIQRAIDWDGRIKHFVVLFLHE